MGRPGDSGLPGQSSGSIYVMSDISSASVCSVDHVKKLWSGWLGRPSGVGSVEMGTIGLVVYAVGWAKTVSPLNEPVWFRRLGQLGSGLVKQSIWVESVAFHFRSFRHLIFYCTSNFSKENYSVLSKWFPSKRILYPFIRVSRTFRHINYFRGKQLVCPRSSP